MTDKKKILVFSHALELGGAEKALLALLEAIDPSQYDVDLFLMRHAGELMKDIPSSVNLLPEIPEYASLAVPIAEVLKKRRFGVAYGRLNGKIKAKLYARRHPHEDNSEVYIEYSHKYTEKYMPMVNDTVYDLAVSFLTPHYFVFSKVRARKKIAWIHTDYSYIGMDVGSQLSMWSRYDHIISISPDVSKAFLKVFPSLQDKITVIENMQSAAMIRSSSQEPVTDMVKGNETILLSIGRYCNAKNFDSIPEICSHILKEGIPVKWYIIGYGSDEQLIRDRIRECHMEDHVILLGKKENPYPYIRLCDIYVQPSRYEGRCVSVKEAQLLGRPVVITDYATSGSQLEDGVDGIIVPLNAKKCADGICALIKDHDLQQQLIASCRIRDYSNRQEIQKLYRLI